jgi:hypothetical protein
MKWYKFGFTRLWDNLSQEIRRGRMSRTHAIQMVKKRGEELPLAEIRQFCDYVGVSPRCFLQAAEKFRNRRIWKRDLRGRWVLGDFLIPGWSWQKAGKL